MSSPIMPTFTDPPWGVRGAAWVGHVFGVCCVVRHEEQLLVVVLFCVQRRLDGAQLVVKVDALLLEALDDLIVRLADALRLVVLDESLVEAVLELPEQPGRRRVLLGRIHGVVLEVLGGKQLTQTTHLRLEPLQL